MTLENRKIVFVYDSLYGSAEKIARAISKGLGSSGIGVDCVDIKGVDPQQLSGYSFIGGAPTQAFSASKPMKDFLNRMWTCMDVMDWPSTPSSTAASPGARRNTSNRSSGIWTWK